MGRNRREKARLEKKRKRVRTWAMAIIVMSIVVAGSVKAVWQNSAGSTNAGRVTLGAPTAVGQFATPVVGQLPTPAVVQLPTPDRQVRLITAIDTKRLLGKGEAVLYDVRTPTAYESRHAVGAISFPEAQLETSLARLPMNKKLIFY
ncbi:MAG: rhodanese-like domain-containing protein [Anaerolineae bacterium]|nr:rhodanese-like domain-containing protein [Anaerolineae bacterium]